MTRYLAIGFALGLGSLFSAPADATAILMVGNTRITDNGGGDANPQPGQITFSSANSPFSTTVSVGTSTTLPSIDLASVAVQSSARGTLTFMFTITDLVSPTGLEDYRSVFSGSIFGGTGSVRSQTYLDTSNQAFGTGTQLADLLSTSSNFSLSQVSAGGGGTPFSLTEVVTVTADAGGVSFNFDGSVTRVPEPVSLSLLGVGLVAAGAFHRKRRHAA